MDSYTQTQPKTNEKECKWCGCLVRTDIELCPDCESDEFFESIYIYKRVNMKSISDLRTSLSFTPHEINSSIRHFAEKSSVDFNVYLPSRGMNLQRNFVWSLEQKRELIWSILMNRNIPRLALMNVLIDDQDDTGVYQVIDGKQRLSTMIDFYMNRFTLEIDGESYLFEGLPEDYQNVIKGYHFAYYLANEPTPRAFTDQDKVDWFKFINFAGTPQEQEHFDKLNK